MFENLEKKLSYLKKIKISFGIQEEIGDKVEKVKIFNLDGSTTESEMTLSDIMFFTEHGTVTLPAQRVLERICNKIKFDLQTTFPEFVRLMVREDYQEEDIRNWWILYNDNKINHFIIPNAITEILSSNNYLSGIIGEEETEQHYTYDLKKLGKYIKSKIFFES